MFRKKYSAKLRTRADSWLKQFDSSLDKLTEDQQIVVLEHIKQRRLRKWIWLACLSGFVWLFIGVFGYFVMMNCIQSNMEVIAAIGIEKMEPSLLRQVILSQYFLSGMYFSCFLVAIFVFWAILTYLIDFMKRDTILRAFLTYRK